MEQSENPYRVPGPIREVVKECERCAEKRSLVVYGAKLCGWLMVATLAITAIVGAFAACMSLLVDGAHAGITAAAFGGIAFGLAFAASVIGALVYVGKRAEWW